MKKLPQCDTCDSRFETVWSELHRWCIYAHHHVLAEAADVDLDGWISRQRDLRVNMSKLLPRDLARAISLSCADLFYHGNRGSLAYDIWDKRGSIGITLTQAEEI